MKAIQLQAIFTFYKKKNMVSNMIRYLFLHENKNENLCIK